MKTQRTWPLLLSFLLLAAPAAVQAQFRYTTNGSVIILARYTNTAGLATIPSFVNSIGTGAFTADAAVTSVTIPSSVTNISGNAFYECSGMTSVTIPSSIITISNQAFYDCTKLASVSIPGSTSIGYEAFQGCTGLTSATISAATSIATYAFQDCTALTSVTIPTTVTNISTNAFDSCTSLTAINVTTGNAYYSSSNGVLFNQGFTMLIEYPGGLGGSYTVPGTVTNLASEAFDVCVGLTNVTIPASVVSLSNQVFYGCDGLIAARFAGNAPADDGTAFNDDNSAIIYYVSGASGWSNTYAGRPTELWNATIQTGTNNNPAQTNKIGFNVLGPTNFSVVVQACTNLATLSWTPIQTNVLTNGLYYFSESWKTNPYGRYYRIVTQ